jgi:hypothetical protein
MTVKSFRESLDLIYCLRRDYLLNLIRAFCDFMISLNENDISRMMFGIRISDGVEGFFGIASAIVYLFGLLQIRKA